MKIEGSVAFVTGANRGIGKDVVARLVAHGARKVYAASRDISKVSASGVVAPVKLDVTDDASIAAAAAMATDTTLLINNAGVLSFGAILEGQRSALERDMSVNYFGKWAMAQAFAPILEKNGGGAVCNVLTLVALASMPGLGIYNASKAAAWSMTQSIRPYLAARGIAVHSVFPGAVDTDMLAGVEMPKTGPTDVAEAIVSGIGNGLEDIFPDPNSAAYYAQWKADHKAIEKAFSAF